MRELVTVESTPHVHQNACDLVHLQHITPSELDTAMKREKGEEVKMTYRPMSPSTTRLCDAPPKAFPRDGEDGRLVVIQLIHTRTLPRSFIYQTQFFFWKKIWATGAEAPSPYKGREQEEAVATSY